LLNFVIFSSKVETRRRDYPLLLVKSVYVSFSFRILHPTPNSKSSVFLSEFWIPIVVVFWRENNMSSNSDAAAATVHAHGRLAMLAAHLLPSQLTHHGALHPLHLSSQLPPPPNLAGTLTVVDERTGKKYQLHVSKEGTVKASEFKKVTQSSSLKIFNFDLCFPRNFQFWKLGIHPFCSFHLCLIFCKMVFFLFLVAWWNHRWVGLWL